MSNSPIPATEENLLKDLIRIISIIDRVPQQIDIKQLSIFNISSYKRKFGGLNNAIEKLGYKPIYKNKLSKQEVKEEIIRVFKIVNKKPTTAQFDCYSTISYQGARATFDNKLWNEILDICLNGEE